MKTFVLVIIAGLISLAGKSQITFTKIIPADINEEAYSVLQTYDGGYAICTRIIVPGASYSYQAHLIKTNRYGDTLWTRKYPGIIDNQESFFKQTPDSGFIFCIFRISPGDTGFYLTKTNSTGETTWAKKYLDMGGSAIEVTPDHGYIVAGGSTLMKTDADGNEVWRKTNNPLGTNNFSSLATTVTNTNDGGYITCVTWEYSPGWGNTGIFVIKTNSNGDSVWSKVFNSVTYQGAYSVQQLNDNSFIVGGYLEPEAGYYDCQGYLIRMTETGDTLWTKTIGVNQYEAFYSVKKIQSGGLIACGESGGYGYHDILLENLDFNGNVRWKRIFFNPLNSYGNSVEPTTDGGFILCGIRGSDIILMKTDSSGIQTGTNEKLTQNSHLGIYPNPCTSSATISFTSHSCEPVQIDLLSMQGELIRPIVNKQFPNGAYKLKLEVNNLHPGIFLVRFISGDNLETRKLIVSDQTTTSFKP